MTYVGHALARYEYAVELLTFGAVLLAVAIVRRSVLRGTQPKPLGHRGGDNPR